jgi:small subunit ribosomal protein S1
VEATVGARQISLDNREWWISLDEGYWQALLEQGEIAPEVVPPVDPQAVFQILDAELQAAFPERSSIPNEGRDADSERGWDLAQLALEQGELFSLKVSGANRGGLRVDWNGLPGFIPASHLKEMPRGQDPHERAAELVRHVGESIMVRLIEVDPQQNRLVFSERAALSDQAPSAILHNLRPGQVRRGIVTNLTSFGAFVDLGGIEGLLHISELSWDRVRSAGDILQPGQEVEVYVLSVNAGEGRIALSLKRLRSNPWLEVGSRYQVGELVEGTVTNVVSFGAFVRVQEGVEGLIHVSELAEGSLLHPRNVVHEGDIVRVRVLTIDPANQRLGLSLRQVRDAG